MDMRLDDLTRTCNGLRSSIHILTKMVTQLVNNQRTSIFNYQTKVCLEVLYKFDLEYKYR